MDREAWCDAVHGVVVIYGCKSWTTKKAECWRIDAFELWCWRRLLRVPWTARRSNQSILKEISPEYSLEGLMLKLQYFGHLMGRIDSFEKPLMLGKIAGGKMQEEKGTTEDEIFEWHHLLNGHGFEYSPGVKDGQGSLECCSPWRHKESDTSEWLKWTEVTDGNSDDHYCIFATKKKKKKMWSKHEIISII